MHDNASNAPRLRGRDVAAPATRSAARAQARNRPIRWMAAAAVTVAVAAALTSASPAWPTPNLSWSVAFGGPGNDQGPTDFRAYDFECGSVTRCWVPGAAGFPGAFGTPVQLRLDGSGWSPATDGDFPQQMRCFSPDDCWGADPGPLTRSWERYDGARWSVVAQFRPATGGSLDRFDCADTTHCWAIGSDTNGSLVAVWSGGAWQIVADPVTRLGYLADIACPAVDECWAVGAGTRPLVLHLHGDRWSRVVVARPAGAKDAYSRVLDSVACAAADQCWATGFSQAEPDAAGYDPLLVRLGGSAPVVVPAPLPWPGAMACPEVDDCWMASGAGRKPPSDQSDGPPAPVAPAVAHWDGIAWTVTYLVNPYHTNVEVLEAVACPAPEACWILGSALAQEAGDPRQEHWAPVIYRGTATGG